MKKLFRKKGTKESDAASEEQYGMFVFADKNKYAQGIIDIVAIHGLSGQYGMFVFADKNEYAQGIIDIVAIHGLSGHYCNKWTAPKGANWLESEDFLPAQIPNARIMSYGYNSVIQFSKSEADIGIFAEQLLENPILNRRTDVEKARPVIFVCHSLGGIVFKKASVRAHERSNRFSILLSLIRGVAFFGIPHNGSSIAAWTSIIANMLRASSLGTSTNNRLSKDLEAHSNNLWQISKSFVERGKDLKIYSFFETEKIDLLNFLVVDEHSAVLNVPNEIPLASNGNHSTICRFRYSWEKRFELVWKNLADMVQFASAEVDIDMPMHPLLMLHLRDLLESELVKCHQVFRTSEYEGNKNRNPNRANDTCNYFLCNDIFLSWQENRSENVLMVFADPGCGKSVLSKALVDEPFLKNDSSLVKLYYFFREDDQASGRFSTAMCALLHQLFTKIPTLREHAIPEFRANGEKLPLLLDRLWDVFLAVCKCNESLRVLCIFDGLDECEGSERNIIASHLRRSLVKNLKFIMTSRWSIELERNFAFLSKNFQIHLSGSEELEMIIQDEIRNIIKQEVQAISEETRLNRSGTEILERVLLCTDNRTYLLVYLTFDALRRSIGITTARRLEAFLAELPTTVNEAYEHILTRHVRNIASARKVLYIIVGAYESFTLSDLRTAMSLHHHSITWDDLDLENIESLGETIRTICGLFIRIVGDKVYLIHQTAKRFLQTNRISKAT